LSQPTSNVVAEVVPPAELDAVLSSLVAGELVDVDDVGPPDDVVAVELEVPLLIDVDGCTSPVQVSGGA